jgi:ABC-2 type transport system ATP-binding protein
MDSGPGDEALLLAVAERDMGAFRTLYERHAGWLAIRLARRCNDRDLVADAIQDTFVAVWQSQLGYQPQEIGFPRGFTAFAFVDYIALLKEWTQPAARHAEVRRVLGLVGLSDLGPKRIRAMSGGQRRRVALAQALLGSPPVLILDEPTSGVDPEQRVVLRTVLAEIARTSIVVLSTHQTEDVAALCERVIVLDQGRVRYDGPVTDLTGQAAGRVWLADEPDPAASVCWRTGTGRYRNVGTRARDGVEHVEPSLEDAYLLLRGGSAEDEPTEEVAS